MGDAYNCPECQKKTPHVVSKEMGDYNEIYEIRCEKCNGRQTVMRKEWFRVQCYENDEQKSRKTYLTKWPHMNWSMGVMVESKDHMKAVAKAKGYVPVE